MKKTTNYAYIFVVFAFILLVLIIACGNQMPSKNITSELIDVDIVKTNNQDIDTTNQLKFTSMVLAIFEDSKGNLWIGSDRQGVCRYNGKSFTYFTVGDGLSQINSRR